jgi:hypothetical protein
VCLWNCGSRAGRVKISEPVEWLVIPGDSKEFLLGKDVLKSFGIDVERQIEQLAAKSMDERRACENEEPELGKNTEDKEELTDAICKLVEQAVMKGFPAEYADELQLIACRFDIWRLRLGTDPPAKVPPMKIRLKAEAKPYRCKARKYPPELRRFMEDFNSELEQLGWIYENPNSRWACPALPVKKAAPEEYRQTTDYKPVNALVEAIVGVMPDLHVDLEDVKGSRFFGLFDFIKGYWQLALAEEYQEILSYMTHQKVFTPCRVPQGCTDAALFFQATIQKCLEELLHKHLLIWIDDLLLYANDVKVYLQKMERLFELLDSFGFKLSAKKSSLYEREVKWCGKLISGAGVRHDPERVRTLQALPQPKTAGELQQFLCASNWMRDSLVDYARTVRPLQECLDAAMTTATKKTKRVASGIGIELSEQEQKTFVAVKELLANHVMRAFPREEATMCLLTDASDIGWSVIVTQIIDWKPDVPVAQQQHELLVCLSGTFTGSEQNWSVIEKEAYPIIAACDKLSYLLLRPRGFRLYSDHRNLIYVVAPGVEVKKHIRGKLLRWAMKLSEFKFVIEHIDGESNV